MKGAISATLSSRSIKRWTKAGIGIAVLALVAVGAHQGAQLQGKQRAPLQPVSFTRSATFNVTAYGAKGDGVSDATAGINAAIAAAQANGGGTVYIPAGTYALTSVGSLSTPSLHVWGTMPVTLQGAGRDVTSLVEHIRGKSILGVRVDHTVVDGLTLDAQTYNGMTALGVGASYTTFRHARAMGGDLFFALYYAGPPGATVASPIYNTGNKVIDVAIDDRVTDDGFSFSFQDHALIQNVTHHGSRLALYIDRNVLVDGYKYTTGIQAPHATDGFYLTPPASNITINNFVSDGSGGKVSGGHTGVATNVVIRGERLLAASGYHLEIGNVNGLLIDDAVLLGTNTLSFLPFATVTGAVVKNSTISHIGFGQLPIASVNVTFVNDNYGPYVTASGKPAPTFSTFQGGATVVQVEGGKWSNILGGFKDKSLNTTYTVTGVDGYMP